MRRRDPRVSAARRQYAAAVSRGEVRRGDEVRTFERILAAQPQASTPAVPAGRVLVDRAALAQRLGLPSSATEAEVRAATGRFQPKSEDEEHQALMRQLFPGDAARLGYAPPRVAGFLMAQGSEPRRPVPSAEDPGHRELMARCYPAVANGPERSGHARIHRVG